MMEVFGLVFLFCSATSQEVTQCGMFTPNLWFNSEEECVIFLIEEVLPEAYARGRSVVDFQCMQLQLETLDDPA